MNDEATERSRQLWDSIAAGWDKERVSINEMEYPVTERMIEGLVVQPGDTILPSRATIVTRSTSRSFVRIERSAPRSRVVATS